MKHFPRLLIVATLCFTGCAATGCSATGSGDAPTPTANASAQAPVAGFGGTDLAWIQINIAMNEELLPLLELTPKHTEDPATLATALQVKAFTEGELNVLRQLQTRAGLPTENPHKGMPMPGMVTPADVTGASQLVGAAFDQTVTKLIREHLEQSQSLARSEEKSGVETQTRDLALQILRTREAVLSTMPSSSP
ncbi:DUF305 domain-containing protein [Paractinoplanes brasiliensis]|uniref:Uncharacterized protein (DUF305 family) n=1 Tax=Paractinoplanes brasiliensis TaxID=52695 RepID=A0A4R6K1A2_9ACTN|nr:DUF305 domain-containing protein [Actinoplanes brasiliensis]TDO41376.1 uncharacterized protein (DUF305 family) [Actinoplanes brasiliensis]GID27341.1 DUF305 domain-containing protein [Actinoplanes brasiliensis]